MNSLNAFFTGFALSAVLVHACRLLKARRARQVRQLATEVLSRHGLVLAEYQPLVDSTSPALREAISTLGLRAEVLADRSGLTLIGYLNVPSPSPKTTQKSHLRLVSSR